MELDEFAPARVGYGRITKEYLDNIKKKNVCPKLRRREWLRRLTRRKKSSLENLHKDYLTHERMTRTKDHVTKLG
ncbi:unnamed protein product, partial [Sphenostylis stenocarpa]